MDKHIHVRDFDGKHHQILSARAKDRGLSLAEYVRQELGKLASRPTLEEFVAKLSKRPRPVISRAVLDKALHDARDEREVSDSERVGFAEPQGKLTP